MTEAQILAGLVASRICHDLISPVGAIGNGMELLRAPGGGAEEIELISDCAETASNALQFMRLAFGARDMNESVDMKTVRSVADSYFSRRRLKLNWENAPASAPYGLAQPLLLLALVGAGALPRGGEMTLTEAEHAPLRAVWRLSGPRIALSDRSRELLAAPPQVKSMGPGEVHFALLWLAAEQFGARPGWDEEGIVQLG